MDVNKIAFPSRLLQILEALSEAHFVSVDFEFSGVVSKPATRRKQTLQERYFETKQAAEKYQILQVGLTCAVQDVEKQKYVLRPYNIPISPVFDEDLDLERQFSFQSGAVEFLLKNAFNFNTSFEDGVPYLSRDEEQLAKDKFKARNDKRRFEDIDVAASDTLTLAFLEKVRKEVKKWLDFDTSDGVEILSRTEPSKNCDHGGDLTGFDKRLIHQLIRSEFPYLITISRRQSILIKHMDEEREHQVRKDQYKRLKKKIYAQIGFRWIIEALTGGSLSHIDLTWFARDPETGAPRYQDTIAFEARFQRACNSLKKKRPVLVGHNCFTDLIYLYSSFIAPLPDTAEEFVLRIHNLFPLVVDTKYLFTHNCGNLNPASSLDSIEEGLRMQKKPRIGTHQDHDKYLTDELYHEAGYDSYLTARVLILLSAQLEAKGIYVIEESATASHLSVASGEHELSSSLQNGAQKEVPDSSMVDDSQTSPQLNKTSPRSPRSRRQKKQQIPIQTRTASKFATKTLFEALASTENDDNDTEESLETNVDTKMSSNFVLNPNARPFAIFKPAGDMASEHANDMKGGDGNKNKKKQAPKELKLDALMPPFSSDFWRVYANRLRVFGTVEGLLDLNPTRMP